MPLPQSLNLEARVCYKDLAPLGLGADILGCRTSQFQILNLQ